MKTAEDKSPSAQSLEPDAARIPLLKQSTSEGARWNCPQGEGLSTQVPGAGEAREPSESGTLCTPWLSWGLIPVLNPHPKSCRTPPTWGIP